MNDLLLLIPSLLYQILYSFGEKHYIMDFFRNLKKDAYTSSGLSGLWSLRIYNKKMYLKEPEKVGEER